MLLLEVALIKSMDVVEIIVILAPMLVAIYYNNYRMRKENQKEMGKKADVEYVDKQNQQLKDYAVDRYDSANKRIDSLKADREKDMQQILTGMAEIRKYIWESKK